MVRKKKDPARNGGEILERGNIYFAYRPRVQQEEAEGIEDIERFYMVLKPEDVGRFRLMVIGRKRLPDIGEHERNWGFVDKVAHSAKAIEGELRERTYQTKTRGERVLPAARPAGEGVYALVQVGRNMHLVYDLELPGAPGPVQKELKIAPEASFVISIKNPEKPAPPGTGLGEAEDAEYPKELQKEFAGRRFAPTDPRLLDYEGAEFVLVGARDDPERQYDLELEPERESLGTAEIVKELRMVRSRHPVAPLLQGEWR